MSINRLNNIQNLHFQSSPLEIGPKKNDESVGLPKDNVTIGGNDLQAQPEMKKWTILHYGAGDNNLEPDIHADVNEIEVVGSNEMMNLIAQLDRGNGNCKIYYLQADGDLNKINSPVVKDLGETNMADPRVLADFIKLGIQKYPAEHVALVIGDHGDGWKGAVEDESHGGWMSTPNIREALATAEAETGKKIDVLGFDCCLMATTEVAYELKDNVSYMVASEETEGGAGWSYTPLINRKGLESLSRALRSRLNISPEEFAKKMITNAEKDQDSLPTLSAVDMSKVDDLAIASEGMAEAILATDTPNSVLKGLVRKTQEFSDNRDQFHFAELITRSPDITDEKLKGSARDLMAAIETAVIAEQHSGDYPDAHGLTAEIISYGHTGTTYKELRFARDSSWDEAMDKMAKTPKKHKNNDKSHKA